LEFWNKTQSICRTCFCTFNRGL